LGIESTADIVAWCAASLAEAVNAENERTRTTDELTEAWVRTAVRDESEREHFDAAVFEGWEDIGVYSVHFQERSGVEDETEHSVLVISHHDTDHNQEQRWETWSAAEVAGWMTAHLDVGPPQPVAEPESDGEADSEALPATRSDSPDSRTADSPKPHVEAVYAVEQGRVVDLRPQADRPRPMVSPDPHIEVMLDSDACETVTGELYLTAPSGERHVVEISGHGSTIVTDDVHLPPGYHSARLVLRDSTNQSVIDFVELDTLLVMEAS
jgi:hypothetical protein